MKRTKRVYISGPITGIPGAISAAQFDRAEQELRAAGYKYVINPRAMFEGTGLTWDEIMVQCLDLVKASDLIVLLPGWQKSRGVTMELGAAYALGIPVHEYRRRLMMVVEEI